MTCSASEVDLPDVGVYEAIGSAEFRAGRTLDALQSDYRVGARVAWRAMVELAEGALDPRALVLLSEAIFAYIDRLADASVAGYAREQSLLEGSVQTRRHAVGDAAAARRRARPGRRAARRRAGRLALPAQVVVVALGDGDPMRVVHLMPVGTIGTTVDGGGVLVVPDPGGPGRQRQLALGLRRVPGGLGPAVPWRARVGRRAMIAWPLHAAGRFRDDALARGRAPARPGARARRQPRPRLRSEAPGTAAGHDARCPRPSDGDAACTARRPRRRDAHNARAAHPPASVGYRLNGLREAFAGALEAPLGRLEIAAALRAADLLA